MVTLAKGVGIVTSHNHQESIGISHIGSFVVVYRAHAVKSCSRYIALGTKSTRNEPSSSNQKE